MPRVRIGLTGLACVFLLVLIAAALFGNQRVTRRVLPEEPLAELGVTPGGAGTAKPAPAKPVPQEPLAQLGIGPGAHPAPTRPATPVANPSPSPGPAH
jgi:hypothetical protein